MEPSVGRIVHYYGEAWTVKSPDPSAADVVPAIITTVHSSDLINLRILGGPEFGEEVTSVRRYNNVVQHGNPTPRSWVWPPRV